MKTRTFNIHNAVRVVKGYMRRATQIIPSLITIINNKELYYSMYTQGCTWLCRLLVSKATDLASHFPRFQIPIHKVGI